MDSTTALILLYVIFTLSASYMVNVLLLRKDAEHVGPFPFAATIKFSDDGYIQQADFFDRVRRLFGVYEVDGASMLWRVHVVRSRRFLCPICLSWWLCLPYSAVYCAVMYALFASWLIIPFAFVLHFALSASTVFAYRTIFQNGSED